MTRPRHVCAIKDSVPAYRQGLARELHGAGHETAEPSDCLDWLHSSAWSSTPPQQPAVLLSVRGEADIQLVAELATHDVGAAVLALLVEPSLPGYRHVIEAGASGVIDYSAPPLEIVAALEASWTGAVCLPRATARELAGRPRGRELSSMIDAADVSRLTALADGWSIERLASHENFSTREMFRRLQELYRFMGVANRHQAVAVAARRGLLDDWQPAGGLSSQWQNATVDAVDHGPGPAPRPSAERRATADSCRRPSAGDLPAPRTPTRRSIGGDQMSPTATPSRRPAPVQPAVRRSGPTP